MEFSRRFDTAAAGVIILAFGLTVYLTKDFLSPMLLSVVLVFLLAPFRAFIFRLTGKARISSFLSLLVVFIIIIAVVMFLTRTVLTEISNLERSGALYNIQFYSLSDDIEKQVEVLVPSSILQYLGDLGAIPSTIAVWLIPKAESALGEFASDLPILFAQLIVVIFFTYYILIDGRSFVAQAVDLLPKNKRGLTNRFLEELHDIYTTLFTVYFTTSMLSGVLAAVGFFLMGIPYPVLWGAVIAIFTLIPLLGPPVVFIPLAIYYLVNGKFLLSLALLAFGTIALMVIPENVIRPHLAHKSARIHPIVTVMAYTAPIFVVGIMGVIIGPTLYGFLLAVYRTAVYYREI
jgi:predicted PurR-regulated permease PerM